MAGDKLDIDAFARVVIDALEASEIEYALGGALSLLAWGEARTTMDVDLVVHIPDDRVEILCGELMQRRMMVLPDIVRQLIADPEGDLAINAIHPFSGWISPTTSIGRPGWACWISGENYQTGHPEPGREGSARCAA